MKVLIISHNPITTYQNMGKTFLSLFSVFSKEELCQLYIYPTLPDIDVCSSYFRITDRAVFNSYFNFGKVHSKIITSEQIDVNNHILFENETDAAFLKGRKKNPISLILRDAMWACSNWYNKELRDWLECEKPECIFLAPGESKFIYNIALKIADELGIGLAVYMCDEYYFVSPPKSLAGKLQLHLLKNAIDKVMKKSSSMIAICDELAEAYAERFGISTNTIYTGLSYPIAGICKTNDNIKGITYMGNLAYKRHESIADIGQMLDAINQELGSDYKLFIYTRALEESVANCFRTIKSIVYCGYVTGEKYKKVFEEADVFLHVESFDNLMIEKVKHSISTKIADCLGSGIPLLAYGPRQVASIGYLNRYNASFVVTEKEKLYSTLIKILNADERKKIVSCALSVARDNHNSNINSSRVYAIMKENTKK